MGRVRTAARRRVERALERHGLLLRQGQWELPSVADLIAGAPVTTPGYSWDYAGAWELCEELEARSDLAAAKLFRGRSTLIASRLWGAVDALAREARVRIDTLPGADMERRMLDLIEATPGIPGGALRERLGLDARGFQRVKGALERRLSVFGRERDDLAHHTHESCWFPWALSKLAQGARRGPAPGSEAAIEMLLDAVYPAGTSGKPPRPATLFPVLR